MKTVHGTAPKETARTDVVRVRTDLDLSRERMARMFDVSAKTIERWEERRALPSTAANRLLLSQLREILDVGILVYGATGLHQFLAMPQPAFDGLSPYQLIERGQAEQVLAALAADYEGSGI